MVRAQEMYAPSLRSKTERPEQSEQYLPTPLVRFGITGIRFRRFKTDFNFGFRHSGFRHSDWTPTPEPLGISAPFFYHHVERFKPNKMSYIT